VIVALRGPLTRWDEERSVIWLEAGGVTYEVSMPVFAGEWVNRHNVGDEVQVFTYEYASERQPAPTLFGFPRLAEREFFRKFIEVPDIGPAKAVRALTRPVSDIARWIEGEDVRSLKQLPGIGDRLAQTIVAHLRGKLLQEALLRDRDGEVVAAPPDARADAIDALVALQYGRREAEGLVNEALKSRPDLDSLEAVLRYVLEQQARPA
jgi:holliday junction DNA helicase RuvA